MKKVLLVFAVLLLFAVPVAIYANQDRFYLGEDEEYNANLYWTGEKLDIMGRVNGDIYAAGSKIVISGEVKGDIIAVAETIKITGTVDGNVRLAAKSVTIDGQVKRALTVLAETIYINDKASVGATALIFARNIEVRGDISGNLDGMAESIFISGKITHTNIKVDDLVLSDTAEIRGNLNYKSVVEAEIPAGAIVRGEINYTVSKARDLSPYATATYYAGKFMKLISLFILGLALIMIMKKPSMQVARRMKEDPTKALLWGLIAFIVTPLLALVLFITIIGIPLALILVAVYVISLYVAKVLTALVIGRLLAKELKWKLPWPWVLLLGLVVYLILSSLPYIGGAFVLLAIWWGMGGIIQAKKEFLKEKAV